MRVCLVPFSLYPLWAPLFGRRLTGHQQVLGQPIEAAKPTMLVLIPKHFIWNSFVGDDDFSRIALRFKMNGDAFRDVGNSLQPPSVS